MFVIFVFHSGRAFSLFVFWFARFYFGVSVGITRPLCFVQENKHLASLKAPLWPPADNPAPPTLPVFGVFWAAL